MNIRDFITNLINSLLDGSFERVRIINQMSTAFKEYFLSGEFGIFPSFPHPDAYVSSVLRSFFSVNDEVKSEYHDYFDASHRPGQQYRPTVGFVQPQEEEQH